MCSKQETSSPSNNIFNIKSHKIIRLNTVEKDKDLASYKDLPSFNNLPH